MKVILLPVLFFAIIFNSYSQTMQATIKPGITPRTIDIWLQSSATFSQKDEAMNFALAIPANITPVPSMGSSGVTPDTLGAVSGITGLQPRFLIINFGATSREVFVSTETIGGTSYYIYSFIFAGTAAANHDWIAGVEQLVFSIQFDSCTSNCNPMTELLVNLPSGGTTGNAYWYFQPNTLGDITNYPAPFYENPQSGPANNGASNDGSTLSTLALVPPIALPIKLKSFTAKANGCSINTTWEIASEVDAAYYSIERSFNASNYLEVARMNATAQNSFIKTYSYSDNNAPSGNLYYRLKMVSKDGTLTYSPVKEISFNCSGKGNVVIYPTLTRGLINIRLLPGYENARIRVINSLGEQVAFDETKSISRNMNIKGFGSGTYIVQVINNNQITDNVKIVLGQ